MKSIKTTDVFDLARRSLNTIARTSSYAYNREREIFFNDFSQYMSNKITELVYRARLIATINRCKKVVEEEYPIPPLEPSHITLIKAEWTAKTKQLDHE